MDNRCLCYYQNWTILLTIENSHIANRMLVRYIKTHLLRVVLALSQELHLFHLLAVVTVTILRIIRTIRLITRSGRFSFNRCGCNYLTLAFGLISCH